MKKELRIRKNEDFNQIYKLKKVYYSKSYKIYFRSNTNLHFGISISKKIGNAITRNKIKRQIRMMILNLIKSQKLEGDYIIVVKKEYLNYTYEENYHSLIKLIKNKVK